MRPLPCHATTCPCTSSFSSANAPDPCLHRRLPTHSYLLAALPPHLYILDVSIYVLLACSYILRCQIHRQLLSPVPAWTFSYAPAAAFSALSRSSSSRACAAASSAALAALSCCLLALVSAVCKVTIVHQRLMFLSSIN
jgi:hypothetical protein